MSESLTHHSATGQQNVEEAFQEDLDDPICDDSQNEVGTQNASQNSSGTAKAERIHFNSSQCVNIVVIDAARSRGWRIIKGKTKVGRCHVHWVDTNQVKEWIPRMDPGMRINHFPGMFGAIGRKSCLHRNLARMQRAFPTDFKFLPQTWVLPDEMAAMERQFTGNGVGSIYIVKPDNQSCGRGIFLTNELDKIKASLDENLKDSGAPTVVQKYIMNPMLIDGLKFDLRLYVLVIGRVSPETGLQLQCFLFKDGLTRLCTLPYEAPSSETLGKKRMHLTNYSVNKKSKKFEHITDIADDGVGHKRSLSWFMKYIAEEFGENEQRKLWGKFGSLCVKMMASAEPHLEAEYARCFPKDVNEPGGHCRCFQILGVDVMLDSKRRPYLIEVNTLPSFETDSPLDVDIKQRLVSQSFDLSDMARKNVVDEQNFTEIGIDRPEASLDDCDTYMDFERILPVPKPGKLYEQCKAIQAHSHTAFQGQYLSSRPPKPTQAAGTPPPPLTEKLGKMDVPKESRTESRMENASNEKSRNPTRRRTLPGPPRCASVDRLPSLLARQPKQKYVLQRCRSSSPAPSIASSLSRESLHLKAVQIDLCL